MFATPHACTISYAADSIRTDGFGAEFRSLGACGASPGGIRITRLEDEVSTGLDVGDVITAVNGVAVTRPDELFNLVRIAPKGHLILEVLRKGKTMNLSGRSIESFVVAVRSQPAPPIPPAPPSN